MVFYSSYILLIEKDEYLERVAVLAAMSVESFELSAVPGPASTQCVRDTSRGTPVIDFCQRSFRGKQLALDMSEHEHVFVPHCEPAERGLRPSDVERIFFMFCS